MADESSEPGPFSTLVWDEFAWAGTVRLPSWAGFQSRGGAYGAIDSDRASDGTVGLTVLTEDPEVQIPTTPEQAAGFAYVVDHEPEVAAAILRALVDEAPDAATPDDLKTRIGLAAVFVLMSARDGSAYVGFEFGCDWDEEHGLGVLTHRGEVVEVGGADVAFTDWVDRDHEAELDEADDEVEAD